MTNYQEYKKAVITLKTLNKKIKEYKSLGVSQEYVWGLEEQKIQAKRELQFLLTTI
jgi:hypothetical protein